jgi:hypothetical protein
MNDPLAVGTGDRVTFPDVPMTYLANEQVAVRPFPVPGGEHGRVVLRAPRPGRRLQAGRHEPGGWHDLHGYRLREMMISLRGIPLRLLGILVAALLMAGYVGLTVVLFLPLLGLRRMFRHRSTPVRWDGDAPRHSGVRTLWNAATGSA